MALDAPKFEGRLYVASSMQLGWSAANATAQSVVYKGVRGSLVSIRSPAEQLFVEGVWMAGCLLH